MIMIMRVSPLPPFVLNSWMLVLFFIFILLGGDHNLCWKDLSEEVIRKLKERLENDWAALKQIYQSFGMDICTSWSHSLLRTFIDVLHMFPDTPVKLLKEVFEALQLCGVIDLLEEGKPRATRSLRPALRLQEMEKLRNPDDRPTSYHSSAAVLIIESQETCDMRGLRSFLKFLTLRARQLWWAAETFLKKLGKGLTISSCGIVNFQCFE